LYYKRADNGSAKARQALTAKAAGGRNNANRTKSVTHFCIKNEPITADAGIAERFAKCGTFRDFRFIATTVLEARLSPETL
jgi:hypothetical protein